MSELKHNSNDALKKLLCSLGYHAWIGVKFHYAPDILMQEKTFVMRCKYCDSSLPTVKRNARTGETEEI